MEFKVGDRVRHTWMYTGVDKGTVVSLHPQDCEDGGYCEVEFDCGQTLSIRDGQAEILKEVTVEIPKVYKALVKTKDGRLVSIWADTILEYHEGQVTYALEGSMGIFIRPTLEGAKYNGKSNSRYRCKELEGTLVVHEATPLGNLCSKAGSSSFLFEDRYPAILLGKEVWREEEPRLEPKFKVGDRVKGVSSYAEGIDGLVIKEVFWGADRRLGGTPSYWLYKCDNGINYSDDMLELAPVEEWVDVTKECEVKLSTSGDGEYHLVQINYQGGQIAELGTGEPWITDNSSYKVESKAVTGGKFGWFRVLKLVKH